MRTNLVLNDELVAEAWKYSRAPSKTALVEEALRTFVEVRSRAARLASYRDRIDRLDERLRGLRLRESPARVLRQDRSRG